MTDSDVNKDGFASSITSSLLARARAHDQAAWERIVDVFGPLVYWWCKRRGLKSEDAADIGQEVFTAAARKLNDFHRGTFRGWLRTITEHKIVDHWRSNKDQPAGEGGSDNQRAIQQMPEVEPLDDQACHAEEIRILCHRIVELLRGEFSESDWQAFMQYVVDKQKAADVASNLGMTTNQVYLAKSRILKRLREEFGDEFPEQNS